MEVVPFHALRSLKRLAHTMVIVQVISFNRKGVSISLGTDGSNLAGKKFVDDEILNLQTIFKPSSHLLDPNAPQEDYEEPNC